MGIPVYRNPKAIQSIKIADTLETSKQYDGHNKEKNIRRLYSICFNKRSE